jgi:hypothetical protein
VIRPSIPALLCTVFWTTGAPLGAQVVARWDAARFDQPGQRSLFLRTVNGGNFGLPLGAGDVNGDGREDILLCAFAAGEAFLFISPPAITGIREAIPAPGEVVRIAGEPTLGVECSAGDVNGDGFADVVVGAPGAPGEAGVGAVYVVFGAPALPLEIDVNASGAVLRVDGVSAGDHFGVWVDAVDVDADGVDDVLAGAPDADGPDNLRPDAGEAYVIFGGSHLGPGRTSVASFGNVGGLFTVFGADAFDKTGSALDAGRIDSGPVADLVVGSALNRAAQKVFGGEFGGGDGPDGARPNAGEVAVVFNAARGRTVDLRSPEPDVAFVFGADAGDFAGEEVDLGDADGDGFDDLAIGALTADGPGNLRAQVGESYVIYGGDSLRGRRIDLAQPPPGATTIFGPSAGGITGDAARFIDIDADGRADVFIGSPTGTFLGPDGRTRTGALFFVRSPAGQLPPVIDLDAPPTDLLPFGVILAADPGDILSYSLIRADADGDGKDDVVVNGMTGDGLDNAFFNAGEAYVIEGDVLAMALAPFATGDLDASGSADVADLVLAISALLGQRTLGEAELRAADTNGNGTLDPGDVVGLIDRVLRRNVLATGSSAGTALAKSRRGLAGQSLQLGTPTVAFRLDPASLQAGASALGVPGQIPGFTFSLVDLVLPIAGPGAVGIPPTVTSGSARPPRPSALTALMAVFELPPVHDPGRFRVVPFEGTRTFSNLTAGELRVLVLAAEGALRVGPPLFGVTGPLLTLKNMRGATAGGSLRLLRHVGKPPGMAPTSPSPLKKRSPRELR